MIKKHQVDTEIVKQYKDIQSRYTLRYDIDKEQINNISAQSQAFQS